MEIAAIRKMKGGDIEWTTGCLSSSLSIRPDLGFVHPLHNSVAAQSNLLLSINILLKHHKKKKKEEEGCVEVGGGVGYRGMKVSIKLAVIATFL